MRLGGLFFDVPGEHEAAEIASWVEVFGAKRRGVVIPATRIPPSTAVMGRRSPSRSRGWARGGRVYT